jgi:hypothetical protein
MSLQAGTVANFANSMAEAIENAMEQEYKAVKGEDLPTTGQEDRRLLFAAIAQGVVKHLNDNPDAFRVQVDPTSGDGAVNDVQTQGTLYA